MHVAKVGCLSGSRCQTAEINLRNNDAITAWTVSQGWHD